MDLSVGTFGVCRPDIEAGDGSGQTVAVGDEAGHVRREGGEGGAVGDRDEQERRPGRDDLDGQPRRLDLSQRDAERPGGIAGIQTLPVLRQGLAHDDGAVLPDTHGEDADICRQPDRRRRGQPARLRQHGREGDGVVATQGDALRPGVIGDRVIRLGIGRGCHKSRL